MNENLFAIKYRFDTAKNWKEGYLVRNCNPPESFICFIEDYTLLGLDKKKIENLSPKVIAAMFTSDMLIKNENNKE